MSMRNFLMNWNYKKHAVAMSSLYLGLAVIGNAIFGKRVPADEKSGNPAVVCRQMTNKQHIFNGLMSIGFALDMTLGYFILDHHKKQYK